MQALLSQFLFVHPLVLGALALLPLLWLLLRVTPPSPTTVEFPATRFLEGLIPADITPSKTPWWLLLLRLFIAALVIFALAQPIYNPARSLPASNGPLRIVIDNDWASAQNWDTMTKAAGEILAQAAREEREITFIATANTQDQGGFMRVMSAAEAQTAIRTLSPRPWANDHAALIKALNAAPFPANNPTTVFFSSGLADEGLENLLSQLRRAGPVQFYKMDEQRLPVSLRPPEVFSSAPQAVVTTPSALPAGIPFSVQARTQDGRILGNKTLQTDGKNTSYTITFDIPSLLQNEISQYSIAGRSSAATTYLLDERFRKRSVGIAAENSNSDAAAALTEAATYIRNALEPYTILQFGTIEELLKNDPSMIILPDIGAIPTGTLNALEKWVSDGGLLLRFAGPKMTQNLITPYLVPVPLRTSGRSLDGALSWEKPLKIAAFPATSPFFGMEIPEDVTIKQQVLAEPVQDLKDKTWAALEDGTPLITADQKGKGLLVLVHTTASPDWSNLALSGLYVQVLKRLVTLSGKSPSQLFAESGILEPLYVLDGFGSLKAADSTVKPIMAKEMDSMKIDFDHPPGIYGRGGVQKILNLGDEITEIKTVGALPYTVSVQNYEQDYELDLRPYLLFIATGLLMLDWLIMLVLAFGAGRTFPHLSSSVPAWLGKIRQRAGMPCAMLLMAAALLPSSGAWAQTLPSQNADLPRGADLKYADDLYLAYIKSGDQSIDDTAQKGLEVLADVLARRTSAEPAGVVGIEADSEIISFFPFIYWPVSASADNLSPQAVNNIQHYLDHGGTILFDTRDQNFTAGRIGGSPNAEALRRLVSNLNIPPLQAVPEDHVLTKSFYLLNSFPGRYSGGTLWVEADSSNGRDGVSSVIIGPHDWAGGWADMDRGGNSRRSFYGYNREQEMALRFGVNVMMYALTGNYKADQVHVPHILERLGQ